MTKIEQQVLTLSEIEDVAGELALKKRDGAGLALDPAEEALLCLIEYYHCLESSCDGED